MVDRVESPGSNGAGADVDAAETREWLEALDAVIAHDGPERARQILRRVVERAQVEGTGPIASLNTPYVNTIPVDLEAKLPGDPALERRLRSIVRWNAMAMVVRANKESSELGGHIASYQSVATLYACTRLASTTFGAPPPRTRPAISSTSRATPRPAITREPSWRDDSQRSSSTAFARRCRDPAASPPTRTRG
jgi:hypothetical protein